MARKSLFAVLVTLSTLAWLLPGPACAGPIVYQPVNPAFGGNPLNGTFLLNEAQLQNSYKDPNAASANAAAQKTPLQQFQDSLERAILNRIAQAVTGGIVDSQGHLIPGTIQTADFTITIVDLGGGILQITTTDKSTGQSTVFEVSQ